MIRRFPPSGQWHPAFVGLTSLASVTLFASGILSVSGALTPGSKCPDVEQGTFGICVERCSSHADCEASGQLCCSNGCGHICMSPAGTQPLDKPRTRPCTIMAVLSNKDADIDEIMDSVPAPLQKNHLKAVGITGLYRAL